MRYFFIFTFCCIVQAANTQTPNDLYNPPDVPTDNITEAFMESPFTWQYNKLVQEQGIHTITGYKIQWDNTAMNWGDTLEIIQQGTESTPSGLVATEIRWKKNGISFLSTHKTVVYNTNNWLFGSKTMSDSTIYSTRDISNTEWLVKKKVINKKNKGYLSERAVYLDGHSLADSLNTFIIPYSGKLIGYMQQAPLFTITDSIQYIYSFLDTTCLSYTHMRKNGDKFSKHRRVDYKFLGLNGSYRKIINRPYLVMDSLIVWTFAHQYELIRDDSAYEIGISYDTLIQFTPTLTNTKSAVLHCDEEWVPLDTRWDYKYSFNGSPDSSALFTYARDSGTGLISEIVKELQLDFGGDYKKEHKWVFSYQEEPVSYNTLSGVTEDCQLNIFGQNTYDRTAEITSCYTSEQDGEMHIFDIGGRLVYSTKFSNGRHVFPISNWLSGVYIAQVRTKSGIMAKQFVVL
jgi:hypothetical protein